MRSRPTRARWPRRMDGADVVFGLSAKGALTPSHDPARWRRTRSSSPWPIPIRRSRRRRSPRSATTPSWRPAARTIRTRSTTSSASPTSSAARSTCAPPPSTTQMKIAAAEALAALAREDVPDEVAAAYQGNRPQFGPQLHHPGAVRSAPDLGDPGRGGQGGDGIRRRAASRSLDLDDIRAASCRPAATRSPRTLQRIYDRVRRQPKRVVFAEGEEEQVIRAAVTYVNQRLGTAILVGREEIDPARTRAHAGIDLERAGIEIINARLSTPQRRLCRLPLRAAAAQGLPVPRLPAAGQQRPQPFRRLHGGARRRRRAWSPASPATIRRRSTTSAASSTPSPATASSASRSRSAAGRTVIVADTAVHDMPNAEELADIAEEAAGVARRMGYEPRVAMLAYSTFGHPPGERSERVQEAVKILDKRRVDFEYDGEMARRRGAQPDVDGSTIRSAACRARPTCWSCRRSTRPRSRPRCCRSSAARR